MNRKHFWALLSGLAFATARADGLPFNAGRAHLTGEVVIVKLDPGQRQSVSRQRRLDLTGAQMRLLKRETGHAPRKIQVLTRHYADCTCEMGPVAVWFREGEVELPVFLLKHADESQSAGDQENARGEGEAPELVVDERAQFWFGGRSVPVAELEPFIARWDQARAGGKNKRAEEKRYLFLDAPPYFTEGGEARFLQSLGRLRVLAKDRHIVIFAYGYPDPDEMTGE